MKTIKIILMLLVMAGVINSCKKDDNNQLSGNSITGIVRNENNVPVPNAEVTVDGKTTITNANGEYTINILCLC